MIIASACLAGVECRYDGKGKLDCEVAELYRKGEAVLVCPEALGGMSTPRLPAEMQGSADEVLSGDARILNSAGDDVTEAFVRGAKKALDVCREHGCKTAMLKAKSPSCGCGAVYDGTFSGKLTEGDGVFAHMLLREGVNVIVR